jgi:hypothetical protein
VGHIRGHDSVLRSAVALDAIHPPASLVTFDEVVAFDFATGAASYPAVCPATCPAFVRDDWIELQRTGAWEESVLRAPRGELEPSGGAAAAGTVASEEKKSAPSSGPLVIHATMPVAPAAAAQLTFPARTSLSLVDVEVQNSRPLPSKHAAAAAAAVPSSSPSSTVASRSHSSTSNLRMPDQLLQYNPVAHQHSVVSQQIRVTGGAWVDGCFPLRDGSFVSCFFFVFCFLSSVACSSQSFSRRRPTRRCPW